VLNVLRIISVFIATINVYNKCFDTNIFSVLLAKFPDPRYVGLYVNKEVFKENRGNELLH
jgi:hypothetical protein